MKQIKITKYKFIALLILCFCYLNVHSQSFNAEKTAAINYLKRMYSVSPFEGAKIIEGDEAKYYTVAVSLYKSTKEADTSSITKIQLKAQLLAEQGFAEPCVKFEMIGKIQNNNNVTCLFLCETLEDFIISLLKNNSFDGARIVSAPGNKYIFSTITLDNSKYSSSEMRDKVASLKAKQFVNTLLNGSVISSDIIIRTDENDKATEVSNIETIKERSMGFIGGLELLFSKKVEQNKTTYVYYLKI